MKMMHSLAISLLGVVGLAGTAVGQSTSSDLQMLFGAEPGAAKAMACFSRNYDAAHLAGHRQQNVTRMLAFVSKTEGVDGYFSVSLQVGFRHLNQPFNVAGSCSLDSSGSKTLNCGIDCDGGQLSVRGRDNQSILVEIPESVRIYDPDADEEAEEDVALPANARFGPDDKKFRLDRTDVRDCLPIILDGEIKAEVSGQPLQSQ